MIAAGARSELFNLQNVESRVFNVAVKNGAEVKILSFSQSTNARMSNHHKASFYGN